jgi:hypothetical protein
VTTILAKLQTKGEYVVLHLGTPYFVTLTVKMLRHKMTNAFDELSLNIFRKKLVKIINVVARSIDSIYLPTLSQSTQPPPCLHIYLPTYK